MFCNLLELYLAAYIQEMLQIKHLRTRITKSVEKYEAT